MNKLAVLKLDGDFDQGFRVTLSVGEDGMAPSREIEGHLPPGSNLPRLYQEWRRTYYGLGLPFRILQRDGVTNVSLPNLNDLAHQLEQGLNAWLITESFRPVRETLIETFTSATEGRVLLRSGNPQIRQLPWHCWDLIERYPHVELALSAATYDKPTLNSTIANDGNLNVLVILGNSKGINVDADRQLLETLPKAKTTFLVEPDRQDLTEQLWSQQWDVLFFSGHSRTEGESGRIYINATESLTIADLKHALSQAIRSGLQLAIFNSCDGLGLLRELESLHIPEMIVMREPIPDQVAQTYLRYFTQAYARDIPLYRAAKEARLKLQGLEDAFPNATWLPVIYQNPAFTPVTWSRLRTCGRIAGGDFSTVTPLTIELPPVDVVTLSPSSETRDVPPRIKVLLVGLVSALATSVTMLVRFPAIVQALEMPFYDLMIRSRPDRGSIDPRIFVILISSNDLAAQSECPHPGRGLSLKDCKFDPLLKKLWQGDTLVAASTIFRDEMIDPKFPDLTANLQRTRLGFPQFIGGCLIREQSNLDGIAPLPEFKDQLETRVGFLETRTDKDSVLRRITLSTPIIPASKCKVGYSLAAMVAMRYLYLTGNGTMPPLVQYDAQGRIDLKATLSPWQIQRQTVGYDYYDIADSVQVRINYRTYNRSLTEVYDQASLQDVLASDFDLERVRGKIVLIGGLRPESPDIKLFKTPYGYQSTRQVPGVFIEAQAISQTLDILTGDKRYSPITTWYAWQEWLWICSWGIVGGLMIIQLTGSRRLVAGIITGGLLYISCQGLMNQAVWVPFLPAVIVVVGSSVSVCVALNRLPTFNPRA